jgi:predicted dehydrogenase
MKTLSTNKSGSGTTTAREMKTMNLKIGIIGTGGMARAHARSYGLMKGVKTTCCCDIDRDKGEAFAKKWKVPAFYVDYTEMLEKEELDGVSVVTPDRMHADVSIAALRRGIGVLCEKPMADTLDQAKRMLEAARDSKAVNMINFSKRNFSGLQGAAHFVNSGGIGKIVHAEASYLQGWIVTNIWGNWREDPRFLWRLSDASGSNGALGDIGCHIYDLAGFLCGEISEIYCRTANYDKGVEGNRIGEYVLDANDSFVSAVRFAGGAVGTIHATRWAGGFADRQFARLAGEKGTVEFDSDAAPAAYRCFTKEENRWKKVDCKPTPGNLERFVAGLRTGENDSSDFENGFRVQSYLHDSLRSEREGRPVAVGAATGANTA